MKILFVCLGNICRSPMAEGVMKNIVLKNNLDWKIESAGTESYHVGENPDRRAIKSCSNNGIDISKQVARKITVNDFSDFDIVYSLAEEVNNEIETFLKSNNSTGEFKFLLDEVYPGESKSVPDPYYGNEKDFAIAFELIETACETILKKFTSADSKFL
ncbi:MAG: low molecular weight phosphotyrosine protein phosphatase [Chitinophagales bacterium]|nr:low molecular weight phosphotyrosine protein phosphatase [Chitinophagales bacterium]